MHTLWDVLTGGINPALYRPPFPRSVTPIMKVSQKPYHFPEKRPWVLEISHRKIHPLRPCVFGRIWRADLPSDRSIPLMQGTGKNHPVKSRSYLHSVGTSGYAEPCRTLRIMPEGVGFSGFHSGYHSGRMYQTCGGRVSQTEE